MLLPATGFLPGAAAGKYDVLLRRPGAGSVRLLDWGDSWENWPSPLFSLPHLRLLLCQLASALLLRNKAC